MAQCCSCLVPGPRRPLSLTFANSWGGALGDSKVPSNRRVYLGIVFPEDCKVQPIHMYFSRSAEGVKVLEAACAAAGLKLDRGRIVGSPERLNLFTIDGDLLRVDLDLDAHMGSTLHNNAWVILEKGNRIAPERLAAVRAAAEAEASGPGCSLM